MYSFCQRKKAAQHPICLADIEIVKAHGLVDGISRAGLTVIFS